MAARIPACSVFPKALDTNPTRVGPEEHPRSPARASMANMTVPPRRIEAEALLNVPGHMIPTENPQMAQQISSMKGTGISEIPR